MINLSNKELDEKQKTEMYNTLYREKLQRETYTHEVLWKAESYFTALISGLIAAGLGIAHYSLYAGYGILPIAIVFTFLGRYVLIKESEYFHGYRYERLIILKELNYDKLATANQFPEFKEMAKMDLASPENEKNRDRYIAENAHREKGTRYAFRVIYLFLAIVSLLVYWLLLLSSVFINQRADMAFICLQPIDFVNLLFITILTLIVIHWYWWEIRSLFRKI